MELSKFLIRKTGCFHMHKRLSYLAAAGAALAAMAVLPAAASADQHAPASTAGNIHMPASNGGMPATAKPGVHGHMPATAKSATVKPAVTLARKSATTWALSVNGAYAGEMVWNANPGGDWDGNGSTDPGDAIGAYDGASDGYGVKAILSTGRTATTKGHTAPYWTGWKTGNLPENHGYTLKGCVFKGSTQGCDTVSVTS